MSDGRARWEQLQDIRGKEEFSSGSVTFQGKVFASELGARGRLGGPTLRLLWRSTCPSVTGVVPLCVPDAAVAHQLERLAPGNLQPLSSQRV